MRQTLELALEALENNRQTHHYCEDTWYSCPKHEEGCANESEGDECNCGADEANAEIDKAITAIHEALAQPKPKQEPVVFFRTDNGWRKEEFEKTLVKKVPLDTTPPEPHVWFDFSNVPLDATPLQRKEALAQMAGFYAGKNKDAPQPKPEQEPVAWLESEPSTKNWPLHDLFANSWSNAYSSRWHVGSKKPDAPLGNRLTPLYLAPPQRTWFGLTEEERDHLEGLHLYAARNQVEAWIEGVPSFIDAIEAKLREKNGG